MKPPPLKKTISELMDEDEDDEDEEDEDDDLSCSDEDEYVHKSKYLIGCKQAMILGHKYVITYV
jgi:hypothetical protein